MADIWLRMWESWLGDTTVSSHSKDRGVCACQVGPGVEVGVELPLHDQGRLRF